MGLTPVLWLLNWPRTCSDMDVTTNARFTRIKTDRADLSILLDPGLSPADALRQYADDLQEKADRLARQISLIRAAADSLLTPEQQQVKELTGFTMDHLQALRHLQQRAELCRKAQK